MPADTFDALERQPRFRLYEAVSQIREALAHPAFPAVLPDGFRVTTEQFRLLQPEEYGSFQRARVARVFHPALPPALIRRNAEWAAASNVFYDPEQGLIVVRAPFLVTGIPGDAEFTVVPVLAKELAHLASRVFEQRVTDPSERAVVQEMLRELGVTERTVDHVVIKRWGMARDYYLNDRFLGQDAKIFFFQDLYADLFGATVFVFASMVNFTMDLDAAVEWMMAGRKRGGQPKDAYLIESYRYAAAVGLEGLLHAGFAGDEEAFEALGAARVGARENRLRLAELAVLRDKASGRRTSEYRL